MSVRAADMTAKDLPHSREWRRVGHWQTERLDEKRPLFLNLTNYGQAGFQSTYVKSIQGSDGREIVCYGQKNPMFQDMVHRRVRAKRSVTVETVFNDEKTKVALVWRKALTGERIHVSVVPADSPLRPPSALANLLLALVAKDEATMQEGFYLMSEERGNLWRPPVMKPAEPAEPAVKRRRRAPP